MRAGVALRWALPEGEEGSFDVRLRQVAAALGAALSGFEPRARTFLDSFDGRLWSRGETMEEVPEPGGVGLVWRAGDGARPFAVLHVAARPRFPDDLPRPSQRGLLQQRLGLRALLPLVTVEAEEAELVLRDARDKVVARAVAHRAAVAADAAHTAPLSPTLRLFPVRGYPAATERMAEALAAAGFVPAVGSWLDAALAALGRRPGAPVGDPTLHAEPSLPAEAAVKAVARELLAAIRANEDGTLRDLDTEFLHDLRVAVRRTRALLGAAKGVFADAALGHFAAFFAWMGSVTGPQRDLDVWLLSLPELAARLPEAHRPHLAPLRGLLEREQAAAHAALVAHLRSDTAARGLADWADFLARSAPARTSAEAPRADMPIGELARTRVRKLHRRILAEGRAITSASPAEALHDLRKTAKKLRYVLEFFAEVLPGDASAAIKHLKKLQSLLGDHQDQEVQAQSLTDFSRALRDDPEVPAETLLALGVLVDDLARAQAASRARFHDVFAGFDSPEGAALFAALHGAAAPPGAPVAGRKAPKKKNERRKGASK